MKNLLGKTINFWRRVLDKISELLIARSQNKIRPLLGATVLGFKEFTAPVFKASSFLKEGENLTLANLAWQFQTYHLALALMILVVGLLVSLKNPFFRTNFTQPTQREKAELSSQIDRFTPGLDEDATSLYLALSFNEEGYIKKPLLAETVETPVEVKEAKRGELKYEVQSGDTLSSIGWKFGLKLASLKYSNNLENLDSLKPGQVLTLPPEDLSPTYIAKIEAKKQAELAKRSKKLLVKSGKRAVTVRERAAEGFDGGSPGVAMPINYEYISRGVTRGHTGIDMVADTGTPVRAAKAGRVIEISKGWSGGYGNEIILDHGEGVKTRYAHLSGTAVSVGQTVSQGQTVGYAGSTGRSTGSHLHFEYLVGGRPTNPF